MRGAAYGTAQRRNLTKQRASSSDPIVRLDRSAAPRRFSSAQFTAKLTLKAGTFCARHSRFGVWTASMTAITSAKGVELSV